MALAWGFLLQRYGMSSGGHPNSAKWSFRGLIVDEYAWGLHPAAPSQIKINAFLLLNLQLTLTNAYACPAHPLGAFQPAASLTFPAGSGASSINCGTSSTMKLGVP